MLCSFARDAEPCPLAQPETTDVAGRVWPGICSCLGLEAPGPRLSRKELQIKGSHSCKRNCFAKVIINATPFFRGVQLYQHHLINIHVIRAPCFICIPRLSVPVPNLHPNAPLCPAGLPAPHLLALCPSVGEGQSGARLILEDQARTLLLSTPSRKRQDSQQAVAGHEDWEINRSSPPSIIAPCCPRSPDAFPEQLSPTPLSLLLETGGPDPAPQTRAPGNQ